MKSEWFLPLGPDKPCTLLQSAEGVKRHLSCSPGESREEDPHPRAKHTGTWEFLTEWMLSARGQGPCLQSILRVQYVPVLGIIDGRYKANSWGRNE